MSELTINVEVVKPKDIPRVVQFLIDFYFTDEPLSRNINLTSSTQAVNFLRRYCTAALNEGISLMATIENGKIVGVLCNQIITRDQQFNFNEDPKTMLIINLMLKAVEEANIFEHFPGIDKAFYAAFMSIRPEYRGLKIAKRLLDEGRLLALEFGVKVMRMDCCSNYSAQAVEKYGYRCFKKIYYADYKIDGVQVFKPPKPHTFIGVFAGRIDLPPIAVKPSL